MPKKQLFRDKDTVRANFAGRVFSFRKGVMVNGADIEALGPEGRKEFLEAGLFLDGLPVG